MTKDTELSPINWDEKPAHAHLYRAVTSVTSGHAHVIDFFVYPVNGDADDGHSHSFQGHTQMSAGHFHRFIGRTGPAIPLPDGSHVHALDNVVDNEPFSFKGGYYRTELGIPRHIHAFTGTTGKGIGYWPPDW